jgi:hypothetical protein
MRIEQVFQPGESPRTSRPEALYSAAAGS